jgi:hypothetical protein
VQFSYEDRIDENEVHEELEHVFAQFSMYDMKILLGKFNRN